MYNQIERFSPSDKPPRQLIAYLIIFKKKKIISNKKSLIQPQENLDEHMKFKSTEGLLETR